MKESPFLRTRLSALETGFSLGRAKLALRKEVCDAKKGGVRGFLKKGVMGVFGVDEEKAYFCGKKSATLRKVE